jgi:hypothetical protein
MFVVAKVGGDCQPSQFSLRWRLLRARSPTIFARAQQGPALKNALLRLFELALMLVRLDHVASFIANANHGIM